MFGSMKFSSMLPSLAGCKSRATVYFEAGIYWMDRNNFNEACEKFRQCLYECKYGKEGVAVPEEQMEQLVFPALCNLAACCIELKQYSKATFYCSEVLQKKPSNKRAMYLQSIANVEMGSFKAAMRYYHRR